MTTTLWVVAVLLSLSGCPKMPNVQPVTQVKTAEASPLPAGATAVAAAPAKPAVDRNAQVVVLGYHRFVEKVRHPDTEITPGDFEKQMQALKGDGIKVIPLKQFLAWRHGEQNVPSRSAIITIDDGYNSAYDVAWPILKKFDYPFTLFIYTDYVKGGPKSGGGSLTWGQLAEMRDAGVGIQSHTISHPDLRGKRHKGQDYETWLWNELNGSKEMLEQKLGLKVTALAVPYERYDDHVKEMAEKAGYEMVFTVNGEKLAYDTPANALGRYMIQSNEPKIFASAVTFGNGGSASGEASLVSAQLLDPQPADGAVIGDEEPPVRASLAALGEIEAGSASLRMSGVGLLPAQLDSTTQTISCQIKTPLEPDTYTVIVSAKSNGRKLEGRWSFTVKPVSRPGLAKGPQ
ncbi:MAG: polysaccharide deacetylase family protein [Chthoniobacteraceae bacterium]